MFTRTNTYQALTNTGGSTFDELIVDGFVLTDLIPDPNLTLSLGSPTHRFSTLFAGSIDIAAGGLDAIELKDNEAEALKIAEDVNMYLNFRTIDGDEKVEFGKIGDFQAGLSTTDILIPDATTAAFRIWDGIDSFLTIDSDLNEITLEQKTYTQDLIPDIGSWDVGTSSLRFSTGFFDDVEIHDTLEFKSAGAASIIFPTGHASGLLMKDSLGVGWINFNTVSGQVGIGKSFYPTSASIDCGLASDPWDHVYTTTLNCTDINADDVNSNRVDTVVLHVTQDVDSDLKPDLTATHDLGSNTERWLGVWGIGANFSGASSFGSTLGVTGTLTSSHVYPSLTNSYDIGSSAALQYRNVYAQYFQTSLGLYPTGGAGTADIGGAGVLRFRTIFAQNLDVDGDVHLSDVSEIKFTGTPSGTNYIQFPDSQGDALSFQNATGTEYARFDSSTAALHMTARLYSGITGFGDLANPVNEGYINKIVSGAGAAQYTLTPSIVSFTLGCTALTPTASPNGEGSYDGAKRLTVDFDATWTTPGTVIAPTVFLDFGSLPSAMKAKNPAFTIQCRMLVNGFWVMGLVQAYHFGASWTNIRFYQEATATTLFGGGNTFGYESAPFGSWLLNAAFST